MAKLFHSWLLRNSFYLQPNQTHPILHCNHKTHFLNVLSLTHSPCPRMSWVCDAVTLLCSTEGSHTSGTKTSWSPNCSLHLRSQWKKDTMVICYIANNVTSKILFPHNSLLPFFIHTVWPETMSVTWLHKGSVQSTWTVSYLNDTA